MDKHLRELRAQRELIRTHLDWLEAQIDALEGTSLKETVAPDSSARPQPDSPSQEEAITDHRGCPDAPAEGTSDAEQFIKSYRDPAGDPLLRAKIGCLVLFVIGVLGFLFLLFGLPYLIG